MEEGDYRTTYELEGHNWWFVGMRRICRDLLLDVPDGASDVTGPTGPVLDVGCGTGIWLDELRDLGLGVGLDPSPLGLGFCQERGLPRLVRGVGEVLPFGDATFGVVTAVDVVEHIEPDAAAVAEWARVLRPGGRLLILTSAYPWLWSGHDESNHHVRRYRRSEVEALVTGAGLRIDRSSYLNSILLPPIAVVRGAQRLARRGHPPAPHKDTADPPGPLNGALLATLTAERRWLKRRDLPAGVSIVVSATKPG